MDYLRTLGADALCLSSIFPATSSPRGHAVSNFREVDPVLGTLRDFSELMLTAKYFGKSYYSRGYVIVIINFMAYGTRRFNLGSQGLSSNPYPEPNQPNFSY